MRGLYLTLALALVSVEAQTQPSQPHRIQPAAIPRADHVVIVIEENKSLRQIINNSAAPYINSLVKKAALFTQSYAVAHPSQPNYLALFSGGTHGVPDDRCPITLSVPNLASALAQKNLSFATYSQSMPSMGYTGCGYGTYQRKHNPAANWQGSNVSPNANLPFTTFHWNYSALPTVAFVIPDQLNDMHDGEPQEAIARGDKWLQMNIAPFLKWTDQNNGLLILTWDEDDNVSDNHIVTMFLGPMVKPGMYSTRINHYTVLRTLTDMFGLESLGRSKSVTPIDYIWISK
jgi:phosphatidylinositol-3-phosphatase